MNARARFAWIALALALPAQAVAARGSELTGDLTTLFDLGTKGTPSAVSAAQTQYTQLTRAHSKDHRLDYAFAVVLVNQHQYRDAVPLLAKYLKTDEPDLTAFYVQMWAEIPLGNYSEVLDQATALARRFPSASKSAEPEEQYRDAARHLGTIFGYLELVRPTAVDSELRAERKNEVMSHLGKTYTAEFEEAQQAVARRLTDLQTRQKAELEKLKASAADRKEQAKSKADETHGAATAGEDAAKSSEKQLEDSRKELERIQTQLSPLQSRLAALQTKISTMSAGKRGPNKMAQLAHLNSQADKLVRQIAPLQKKVDEIKAKQERQANALAKEAAAARKSGKAAEAANKRLLEADSQLNSASGALDSKMARISNYAPFPYEAERKRVLSWYSK